MSAYGALAGAYDALTGDVQYEKRADFLEKLFRRSRIPVKVVLDLACGTGSITWILTQRGYELISVDGSEDMLVSAMGKGGTAEGVPPIFLQQEMPKLDLYGTVEAAVCCLDSLNYLTREKDVQKTFERLHLFIAPGGVLIFDVNAESKFKAMDGQVFLDETEDTYCVWRTEYRNKICSYYLDLFCEQEDGSWKRDFEMHREKYYSPEELTKWLEEAGFGEIKVHGDMRMRCPNEKDTRFYISCIRI